MKKLVKLLLVLGLVLFTAFAAGSSVFAEEVPVPKQEETIPPISEEEGVKPEEEIKPAEVIVEFEENDKGKSLEGGLPKTDEEDEITDIGGKPLDHDGLEDKDISIVEIVEDIEHPDLPGETVITETPVDGDEEKIDEHWLTEDELVVDPDDIELLIEPKFTEEVSNVAAIAVDKDNLKQWVIDKLDWLNITGLKDKDIIKFKVDDENADEGRWVIETDTISYDIYKDYGYWKGIPYVKGYYIKADNGKGDYDKIYIHVFTEEMNIDEGVRKDEGHGGLDINDVELAVPEGETSEEVTIFDSKNLEQFVNGYDETYDTVKEMYEYQWNKKKYKYELVKVDAPEEASEKLSIKNVRIKNTNGGEGTYGLTVVNNDGVISVCTDTIGSYDVYLEGWYTERQYEKLAKGLDINVFAIGTSYFNYNDNYYKIVRTKYTTTWYVLKEHSAWATFADIKVDAVATETPVYIDGHDEEVDNGSREWLVVKPTNEDEVKQEDKEKIVEVVGDDKEVFFFDIDLCEQQFENGKAISAATRIDSVGHMGGSELAKVKVSVTLSEPVAEGKTPVFTVLFRHNDGEVEYATVIGKELVEGNTWLVEFEAGKFSTYAVTYDIVDIPTPPHHHSSSDGYQFVNTGVTEVVQTVDYTGYISLVASMALVVIALRKRLAD